MFRESGATAVWILKQVPEQPWDVCRTVMAVGRLGLAIPYGSTRSEYDQRQSTANAIIDSQRAEHVHVVDPATILFDEAGRSRLTDEQGRPIYADHSHLSQYGATMVASLLEAALDGNNRPVSHD